MIIIILQNPKRMRAYHVNKKKALLFLFFIFLSVYAFSQNININPIVEQLNKSYVVSPNTYYYQPYVPIFNLDSKYPQIKTLKGCELNKLVKNMKTDHIDIILFTELTYNDGVFGLSAEFVSFFHQKLNKCNELSFGYDGRVSFKFTVVDGKAVIW